jgi:hypothetical protein
MSFSDVSAVTSHFATPNEGFTTTTSGIVASGGATVGLNSVSGLTNGSVFVGVVEPGGSKEQIFTGTVDVSSSSITGVVWLKGDNTQHASGVNIVDYVKGLLNMADQDGTLKAGAVDNAAVLASNVVTTAKLADDAVTASKLDGIDKSSLTTDSNPYKFSVYRSTPQNVGVADTKIQFNGENFDTNSNFDSSTNYRYTAPVAGFYFFAANILVTTAGTGTSIVLNFYKNGSKGAGVPSGVRQDVGAGLAPGAQICGLIQLAKDDYVEVFVGTGAAAKALDNTDAGNNNFSGFLVSRT